MDKSMPLKNPLLDYLTSSRVTLEDRSLKWAPTPKVNELILNRDTSSAVFKTGK